MSLALVPAQTTRFQEKREAILAAAAALFKERGVRAATLAEIADRVGLVTNGVTYYFRKKEDLASACFLRAIDVFDGIAIEAASEKTAALRLHFYFRRFAELFAQIELKQKPEIVVFHDLRALPTSQLDVALVAYGELFRHVRTLLKGPETATLSRDALNARAHIVLSLTHWMRAWIGRYEASEYTRMAARMADIVINGLAGNNAVWQTEEVAPTGLQSLQLVSVAGHAVDSGDTSAAFLRAATALVNEQGYRGASVDKISARLHVTKGAFYHHNDTKQDLISACFEHTFSVMREALSTAENGSGSGWDRACTAARTLVRYQLSAAGPMLRSSATSALPDQSNRERIRKTMEQLAERMVYVLVDGIVDRSIRGLDASLTAVLAIGIIDAASDLRTWAPSATTDNVSELYTRPLFLGLFCV